MPNALPHREIQAAAAAGFGEEAQALGRRVLSLNTLTAAQALVSMILTDSGAGPIGEAAGDVRTLRSNGGFNVPLMRDLNTSTVALAKLMLQALEKGYIAEMEYQVTQFKGLSYSVTEMDRIDMRDYPVQGHTCAEISVQMHNSFRYQVVGLLSAPLVGDISAQAMNANVGAAVDKFADNCGSAAEEAYFAGTQMAIRGVAAAIKVV